MTMSHETRTSQLYFSAQRLCNVVNQLSRLPVGAPGLGLGQPAQITKLTDLWLAETLEILRSVKQARELPQSQGDHGDDLSHSTPSETGLRTASGTAVRTSWKAAPQGRHRINTSRREDG